VAEGQAGNRRQGEVAQDEVLETQQQQRQLIIVPARAGVAASQRLDALGLDRAQQASGNADHPLAAAEHVLLDQPGKIG
jgi:hypothetical protein